MTMGRWPRRFLRVFLVLVVTGLFVWGTLFIPGIYFRLAFFLIRHTSVVRDRVDWPKVRAEADALRRQGDWTTAGTYPAIRLVLERLNDSHSHLATPETVRAHRAGALTTPGLTVISPERVVALVSAGGAAEEAGVKLGDVLEAVNGGVPDRIMDVVLFPRDPNGFDLTLRRQGLPEPFTVKVTPRITPFDQPATVRNLAGGLGYIDVPGLVGNGGTFALDAVEAIRKTDESPRCGWVVDLRRNVGGNMWPMLHAVRPILGEATPGYFVSSRGREAFSYFYGMGPGAKTLAYALKRTDPPVAVLTSRLTVSAGEALTVAFRGRPDSRSFGEATAGLATSNQSLPMPDGAVLVVTAAYEADRSGRVYEGRILPDEPIAIDWVRIGSEDDPVLRAATSWLAQQPQCASMPPS